MAWNSELEPLAALVAGAAEAARRSAGAVDVERLRVAMPIELRADVTDDGAVALAVAPPRQALPTTVMPVLHRLELTVEAER